MLQFCRHRLKIEQKCRTLSLIWTVIAQFSNLFKINRNSCYSFSCDFPIRYVNSCPESKTLSLKPQHLKLKSKHCNFFLKKPLFPAWKFGDDDATDICVTMASSSVRNLNVQSSITQKLFTKNFFWVLLKWIIVSDIYEHVHHKIQGSIILEDKLA